MNLGKEGSEEMLNGSFSKPAEGEGNCETQWREIRFWNGRRTRKEEFKKGIYLLVLWRSLLVSSVEETDKRAAHRMVFKKRGYIYIYILGWVS